MVNAERFDQDGPYVLACTHAGHLEPALLTATLRRPVHWVARVEFFRPRWAALLLKRVGAIPVDRNGVPVRTIRTCVRRLGEGQIIGIFPEGGRTTGPDQAVLGGPVRGGACLIAMRAGVPVVPVVIRGLDAFHHIERWVPGRRTTVQTLVGQPILPADFTPRAARRTRRREMTARLGRAFVDLYQQADARAGGRT
ncbi:MAG TPA: lysophospholipid acyltransferase family protein [Tepidisphaeraceae bacterium]|jgi:1-acyl-sn-glycerol-3-phosphate acyltransferase